MRTQDKKTRLRPTRLGALVASLASIGLCTAGCVDDDGAPPDPVDVSDPGAAPADVDLGCVVQLYEDSNWNDAYRDYRAAPATICLATGSYSARALIDLGLTTGEFDSLDVEPGYRAIATRADDSASVYALTQPRLTGDRRPAPLRHLDVTFCPVAIVMRGETDAQARCLGLGTTVAADLGALTTAPDRVRKIVIADGFAAQFAPAEGPPLTRTSSLEDDRSLAALGDLRQVASVRVEPYDGAAAAPPTNRAASPSAFTDSPTGFSRLVIFGDSLSDQTNFDQTWVGKYIAVPQNGYWRGRFTNWYNWVDWLEHEYQGTSGKLINKAHGGAMLEPRTLYRISGRKALKTQAYEYMNDAANQATFDNTLFVVFGGSNDFLAVANEGDGLPSATTDETIANRVSVVVKEIRKKTASARIMIVNIPRLGDTPITRYADWSAAKQQAINNAIVRTNNRIYDRWGPEPATTVLYFASFVTAWVDGDLASPYMPHLTSSCFTGALDTFARPGTYVADPCHGHLFFDRVHPTTLGHCGMAGLIYNHLHDNYGWFRDVPSHATRIKACAINIANQAPWAN